MTDREKLVEMINHVSEGYIENLMQPGGAEAMANYMIANGVTVKEPQKPIAETDLGKYLDMPVWFEELGRDVEYLPLLLDGIGIYYAEFKEFGKSEWLDRRIDDYNYQWRCWAEKPTEEERKAAEWE